MDFLIIFLICTLTSNLLAEDISDPECSVTHYTQIENACAKCSTIEVYNLTVPAGITLNMKLQDGATIIFQGKITWGFVNWKGPLIRLQGNNITARGEEGHVWDGRGQLWWDGKGGSGPPKPKLLSLSTTGGSVIEDIYILNCPGGCVSVSSCHETTIRNWLVDLSLGDILGGHNTDGFDISYGKNIYFRNVTVKNQDDCVAINSGQNLYFENMECHGSHGLSMSVGLSPNDGEDNTAKNVLFANSKVINSANGIHIKTHPNGGTGIISNVTYKNIELIGITNYGIQIEQDYADKGHLNANVPIVDLNIINVKGTMASKGRNNVYIACASEGCSEFHWKNVKITGAEKNYCNYKPEGYIC